MEKFQDCFLLPLKRENYLMLQNSVLIFLCFKNEEKGNWTPEKADLITCSTSLIYHWRESPN